ncbi:MAG: permease [Pirellulales bacterium]
MSKKQETWYSFGDINAFFGLTLDNIAGLVLIVGILVMQFGVPAEFAFGHLVPGTAIGVLVGDFLFFLIALLLAWKTGRWTVTAMPLGLDTPSIFGMAFFVLGPAFLKAKNEMQLDSMAAANYMWEIGICSMFYSGVFKMFCSIGSNWARTSFPRAGLLGSLAAIALVIISFLPLLDIFASPIVGMIALGITLTALVGRVPLPFKLPGVVGALLVAGSIHYLMQGMGWLSASHASVGGEGFSVPQGWMEAFQFHWLQRLGAATDYLPIVLPLAFATVIGGIDCTESAAAVGDHFSTRQVIGVEALATLIAALCGGVIQTTPYIGHPAYKAMGGRSAYTLATALFIGSAGIFGYFRYFYEWIPDAAVYPILIFVGLEISAQSFLATPKRHYPAVAMACVPALAFLAMLFVGQIFGDPHVRAATYMPSVTASETNATVEPQAQPLSQNALANGKLKNQLQIATLLSSGFVVTSLLWASSLALAIDRRLWAAAGFTATAGVFTLFGIIHSPMAGGSLHVPIPIPGIPEGWVLAEASRPIIFQWALGYFLTAILFVAWGWYLKKIGEYGLPAESDGEGI